MLDRVGERALIRLFCLGVHSPAHYQAYCPSHCYPYPGVSLFCNFPYLTDTTTSPSTPILPHFPSYPQPLLAFRFSLDLLASSFPTIAFRVLIDSIEKKVSIIFTYTFIKWNCEMSAISSTIYHSSSYLEIILVKKFHTIICVFFFFFYLCFLTYLCVTYVQKCLTS